MDNAIKEVVDKYNSILNIFKALEKQVKASYEVCVRRYRAENHISRKNHQRPSSWDEVQILELYYNNLDGLELEKGSVN